MGYCEVSDVKEYSALTGSTDDVLLESLIKRATAMIDQFCQRTFAGASDTARSFDAVRDVSGSTLYLDEDLCDITTITNGDSATVTSTKYTTEPRNRTPYYAIRLLPSSGLVWTAKSNGDSENAISITGRWAFSTVPSNDIVHACMRLATWLYRQKDNATDQDRALIVGNATILPSRLPSDVLDILKPYRRLT